MQVLQLLKDMILHVWDGTAWPGPVPYLCAIWADKMELDMAGGRLQDIPGAVLKEGVEAAMQCVAPAAHTIPMQNTL